MAPEEEAGLARFLAAQLPAAELSHREHLRYAYLTLARYDFPESVLRYSRALRAIATQAGRPEKFNQTQTIALLALISERQALAAGADFEEFARRHPELFERSLLAHWYGHARLMSPLARRTFLLPEPHATDATAAGPGARGGPAS
jgi:hypothetical protein